MRRETGVSAPPLAAAPSPCRQKTSPRKPPAAIAPIWLIPPGATAIRMRASMAIAARGDRAQGCGPCRARPARQWLRRPASAHATALRPRARCSARAPYATSVMTIADGSVKPAQAASAPKYPARMRPMANPIWLLAGPGRNWQSATRSPNTLSSSQPRSTTNALWK